MPKRRRDEEEDDVIEEVDEEEPAKKPARGPQAPRLSITLSASTRKKVRLAAALRDMEPNEWARVVLVTAARKTVEKNFPDLNA